MEDDKSDYEQLQNTIKKDEEQKNQLRKELKYPFKDFTLIPDLEDEPYINGEFYLRVSLNRLLNRKDFYNQKLQELKFMKNYADSKNLENEKGEFYEKTI